jgi:hypothetical protein
MPCYTIRTTPVTFTQVFYKAGHWGLLLEALKHLGFEIRSDIPVAKLGGRLPAGRAVKIWPAGAAPTLENTIVYTDGRFEVPSPLQDRFRLEALQQAYAREAIQLHARRNGWRLRQLVENEFEVTR